MRFFTLFSGSSGNSVFVESGHTRILIDAGKNAKAVCSALEQYGYQLSDMDAIFLTHGHSDHISAIPVIAGKCSMPIFGREDTLQVLVEKGILPSRLTAFYDDGPFTVGDLTVTAFDTPHDIAGSVGYTVSDREGHSLTLATDLGEVTPSIYQQLKQSQFVILESNYDVDMLENGPYPYELKKRIDSPHGHLANGDCAYTVCKLCQDGVCHFLLAHLSEHNNSWETAMTETVSALAAAGYQPGEVTVNVAPRNEASPIFEW